MKSIRVFIFSDYLMFGSGLKSLLLSKANVEIVGEETDIDRAVAQIDELKPNVLIWGSNDRDHISLGDALHLLETKPGLKIIVLNLDSNEINIYESAQKTAQDLPDLVDTVEHALVRI